MSEDLKDGEVDRGVEETEPDNLVVMNGKEFRIEPPDGIIILRVLRLLSKVIQRADSEAKALGFEIFKIAAKTVGEAGEESAPSGPLGLSDDLLQKILVFLSVLEEEDLLKLGSAFLQFKEESYGVKWLKSKGLRLAPLMQAVVLNLQQMEDVVEALKVFTPTLTGLRLLSTLSTAGAAAQGDGEKPSSSSES